MRCVIVPIVVALTLAAPRQSPPRADGCGVGSSGGAPPSAKTLKPLRDSWSLFGSSNGLVGARTSNRLGTLGAGFSGATTVVLEAATEAATDAVATADAADTTDAADTAAEVSSGGASGVRVVVTNGGRSAPLARGVGLRPTLRAIAGVAATATARECGIGGADGVSESNSDGTWPPSASGPAAVAAAVAAATGEKTSGAVGAGGAVSN